MGVFPASPRTSRPRAMLTGIVGIAATISFLLAGCGSSTASGGSSTTTGSSSASTNCPSSSTVASWHLVNSGHLTVASDTTYPPAEYLDANQKPVGYDMDLAREFAKRLCLKATIDSTSFDDIIPSLTGPSLGSQKYDMSLSSFTITSARQQKVDMIPYFQAGESIIVPANSSLQVNSLKGLCGKTVAVETGTVEEGEIDAADKAGGDCASNKIRKAAYTGQDEVVQQVINGAADAGYQDSPVTDYYVKKSGGKVKAGGYTVSPSPEGIVMRKDNAALETAIKNALSAMVSDGTYQKILANWGAQSGAYTKGS